MAAERRTILLGLPGADRLWLRVAVLAIGLLMMSRHLTGPFTGKHEFNSAMYTLFRAESPALWAGVYPGLLHVGRGADGAGGNRIGI
jgi:hypothetical protein